MIRTSSIEHITLSSGAARMSSRNEVKSNVIAEVARCLASGGALWAGWSVVLAPVRANAIPGVESPPGAWIFDAVQGRMRVTRSWLCRDPAASDQLWEAASSSPIEAGVILHRPRGVPWLASWLDDENTAALFAQPQVLIEAGDLERCVAWALLDGAD